MEWFRANASGFGGTLAFDEPLSKHTYYRIGGPATVFAVPKSREDLLWISRGIRESGIRYFVLGAGSNLLVSDSGFPGLVIRANRMQLGIEPLPPSAEGEARIRTGSGVAVSTLLRRAAQEGWGGLEFLTGIPGSIGGVVFMNAGTHLGEAVGAVRRVEAFLLGDEQSEKEGPRAFSGSDLAFEYRKNLFLPKNAFVWSAEWRVSPADPSAVRRQIDETLARRKSTQPIDFPSCGSVFKNPREGGLKAWEVIEQLGLRGHRMGDAQFSEKHPNFIVNLGSAKSAEVMALIQLAQSRAEKELGVRLQTEVIQIP